MLPQTEMPSDGSEGLDLRSDADILARLLAAQQAVLSGLGACLPDIAKGAELLVDTVQRGGQLFYVAAGSSGLMGLADGAELPGTYGLSPDTISICMAGGIPTGADMPGHTEDDADAAQAATRSVNPGDTVIAISASGSTPYPLAFVRAARAVGARTVCIANAQNAPLLEDADCAICLDTPPEIIAGSTRMGAATAQKVVLNMMSTLMGIRLGHVHDGMMVNVIADNQKLRQRAEGIVQRIAKVTEIEASAAMDRASGNLKQAILLAAGASTLEQAEQLLARTDGHLRPALQHI